MSDLEEVFIFGLAFAFVIFMVIIAGGVGFKIVAWMFA